MNKPVVPVTPDTRATTTPTRTTSIASTNNTAFEGVEEQLANRHLLADWGDEDTTKMITSDERELAINGFLPKGAMAHVAYPNPVEAHTFKRQLRNTLAQVPSIVYKFGDGYSFLIHSLALDNPTVTIGVNMKIYNFQKERCLEWEQYYNTAAMQLINRKLPNMLLSGLRNPMLDTLPVGITAKAIYDHIKSQIDTSTNVLQESYVDLLTKIQARKYRVTNSKQTYSRDSLITDDGIVMMCALCAFWGSVQNTCERSWKGRGYPHHLPWAPRMKEPESPATAGCCGDCLSTKQKAAQYKELNRLRTC
eukprot:jgi/Psemu1/13592/gm1.13592_g